MSNIFDYIKWRGDLKIDAVPLCDADRLILAELAYVDFAEGEPISLAEACRDMVRRISVVRKSGAKWEGMLHNRQDEELLKAVMNSKRFCDIKIGHFESRLNKENEEQFAAMTVLLPDSTVIVVYRGTDWSLVGWKEDFSMTWRKELPSQKSAVIYLEKIASMYSGKIEILGHSKGGNLAVYAGSFTSDDIVERITRITNLDGPGFNEEVNKSDKYLAVIDRVVTFMPRSSIVGELFSSKGNFHIVKSRGSGAVQHVTFNWEISGGDFVRTTRDLKGKRVDNALNRWINSMENEERRKFIDTVWSIIDGDDIITLGDLIDGKNTKSFLEKYRSMDKESRDFIKDTLAKLREYTKEEFINSKKKKDN